MATSATPSTTSALVAARARALRKTRGWSAENLADRLTAAGCPTTRHAVANRESRASSGYRMSLDEAVALAAVFGLTLDELVSNGCSRCKGAPPPGFVCGACGLEGEIDHSAVGGKPEGRQS